VHRGLLGGGFTPREAEKILFGNWERLLGEVWPA
jgi:microsomal dipeptidase-like Zn-dependent dipeptidase